MSHFDLIRELGEAAINLQRAAERSRVHPIGLLPFSVRFSPR